MNITKQMAKNLREVHFGGNWTSSNLKDNLADVTWQQATTRVDSFNTIVTLVYHIHYYVGVASRVLRGGPLEGKDELSFNHPPIQSEDDWQNFLSQVQRETEEFATLMEQLPDSKLSENFTDEKYGTYYRNLQGIIEHTHYHLGQIVIIKKLLRQTNNK